MTGIESRIGWSFLKTSKQTLKLFQSIRKKNYEIPILASYEEGPNQEFWENFPFMALPDRPVSRILVEELKKKLFECEHCLSRSQIRRALKTIESLKKGASSCQASVLPACMVKNAKNTITNGEAVTDTICTWVKKGFAAGPFLQVPLEKFRVNCLMAVPQHSKVRPVLNASLPEGRSLNSNVDDSEVESVTMCSARCFSYSIMDAGRGAYMAKMDMEDAYKNVPCKTEDLRLQGFFWLDRFFVETRQIFGAKTAVSNFDVLGKTVLDLVMCKTGIPSNWVHRQLDDVPIVVPYSKKYLCEKFVSDYRRFCDELNIGLAPHDVNLDKAFDTSQKGKILGIWFDTQKLMWKYPDDKSMLTLQAIADFLNNEEVNLLQMQKLMGRLNDISLMCPFLRNFKGPLNELLGLLQKNDGMKLKPSVQCKKDVLVWAGFLLDQEQWNPIACRPSWPPMNCLTFTSDAAGFNLEMCSTSDVGVASVGMDVEGNICMVTRLFWPEDMRKQVDDNGCSFGAKSIFLEIIGLLLPLIVCPELIMNQHVILKVDNLGCYYGWEGRKVKGDREASIIIRSMAVIAAYLHCCVHVQHLPRMSTWDARLCDKLSRARTTSGNEYSLLSQYSNVKVPVQLRNWLNNEIKGWDLCETLLEVVKNKCEL
jgi:hypothetical protein